MRVLGSDRCQARDRLGEIIERHVPVGADRRALNLAVMCWFYEALDQRAFQHSETQMLHELVAADSRVAE